MILVSELCRCRCIQKVDLPTPLLIPSFSSKGFPNLKMLLSVMQDHVTDVAMVSSYDIFHGNLGDGWQSPNLLFVDSGGYEARQDYDLAEVYAPEYHPRKWSREDYEKILDELETLSALVLVSFDEVKNQVPVTEQVEQAYALFSHYPEAGTDFLIKPYNAPYIDVESVIAHLAKLERFDIIGFTEKELGASMIDRLRSVVQIRRALTQVGLDTPIHIFGCLDPLTVQLFYLCGAGIFDGLSWLRFAFDGTMAIYRNNWAIVADYLHLSDSEIHRWSWATNLTTLTRLRKDMARYTTSFDLNNLTIDVAIVKRVLNEVGVMIKSREA